MIYIYCFAASTFFAYLASRTKQRNLLIFYSVISILITSILGGVRHVSVGTDTVVYKIGFFDVALHSADYFEYISKVKTEPGYGLLCYLCAHVFGDFNWALFFYQLIIITCIYIGAYKHRKKISMPMLLLFYYFLYYNQSYNITRQSIAAAIIFMGIDNLEARRYSNFAVYIAVATLFHFSAFISFLLLVGMHWLITSHSFKLTYFRTIVIYGIILSLVFSSSILRLIAHSIYFMSKYLDYFKIASSYDTAKLLTVIFFGELIIFALYYKNADRIFMNNNEKSFLAFNLVFCVAYQYFVRLMTRVLLYNEVVNLIALASLPSLVRDKSLKLLLGFTETAVILFYWYYVIALHGVTGSYPYKSIL